jgi:hypothetical protein
MIMTNLLAKPVVKNKFWIVEQDGNKVATIQTIDETGGVVYVEDNARSFFPSVKVLGQKHNIVFDKFKKTKSASEDTYDVYGYPSNFRTHNKLYDVKKKLPIFTKTAKSKSYFCAGHYLVKFSNCWTKAVCPKLITLQRYEYRGPFTSKEEMVAHLKDLENE